ncbi:hypothetical protein [Nesterenkonia haasae]|uniref:hypothetical protein n=1 Tax=Nesterenkonia haasae TaxID=2587813 RepID=UPI001391095D|nr:hypothetical protein [Nesterenkonia haasae]NDK32561.1 hypothetical protein [Nesterenkonia haasae]
MLEEDVALLWDCCAGLGVFRFFINSEEVTVVDDGLGELSPSKAAVTEQHRARLIAYRENRGPDVARNVRLAQVRT